MGANKCWVLGVVCCVLCVVCCVLCVVCCVLCVCCVLRVACCVLRVAYCVLCVVCCGFIVDIFVDQSAIARVIGKVARFAIHNRGVIIGVT